MARDGSTLGVMAELVPPFIVDLYTAGSPTAELHDALDVAGEDLIVDFRRLPRSRCAEVRCVDVSLMEDLQEPAVERADVGVATGNVSRSLLHAARPRLVAS